MAEVLLSEDSLTQDDRNNSSFCCNLRAASICSPLCSSNSQPLYTSDFRNGHTSNRTTRTEHPYQHAPLNRLRRNYPISPGKSRHITNELNQYSFRKQLRAGNWRDTENLEYLPPQQHPGPSIN